MSIRSLLITVFLLLTSISATVINVPSNYTTIQAALTAASTNDTILVQPGTYVENIIWPNVNGIKLISAGDSSNTIIDGGGVSSVIYLSFSSTQIDSTLIMGFKIQNGGGSAQNGGGLSLDNNILLSLKNTSVENNNSGGIYFSGTGALIIRSSSISHNNGNTGGIFAISVSQPVLEIYNSNINYNTGIYGGGIRTQYVKLLVDSCNIIGNISSTVDNQGGGGLYIYGGGIAPDNTIKNTSFISNQSSYGGGITAVSPGNLRLENVEFIKNKQSYGSLYISTPMDSIKLSNVNFYKNVSANGGGMYIFSNSSINVTYNNLNIHSNEANLGAGAYIRSPNNPFNISNISFSQNVGESILEFAAYDHNHSIDSVTFSDNLNTSYAVSVTGSATISNSNFINNELAVNNSLTPNNITATSNYWGHSTGPYHSSQNSSGQGDSVDAFVNVTPWLTAPNIDAPPIPAQNVAISEKGTNYVKIGWDASLMSDLSGYKFYYDTDSSGYPYSNSIDIGNVTSHTLSNLTPGTTYYIAVTTYDTDVNESWYSKEISIKINSYPALSGILNVSIKEDSLASVKLSATDADSDLLTYTASSDTSAVITTINADSLKITLEQNWHGSSLITVYVTDGELSDTTSFTLTVTPVNDAPVLTAIGNVTISEEESAEVKVSATDVEGDAITYSASTDTSSVDATVSNDTLKLIPIANWNGVSNISVYASDGSLTDTATFKLTVSSINDAPVISAIDTVTILEDASATVPLVAINLDADTLTFTATSDTSSVIPSVTGDTLKLTLEQNWHGSSLITVYVTDGELSDTTSFTLTVTPVNDAPLAFEQLTPVNSDSIVISEDVLLDSIRFSWSESTDPDNDTLMYNLFLNSERLGDTLLTSYSTSQFVLNESIIKKMRTANVSVAILEWEVLVTDGVDTVRASNSPFVIKFDAYAILNIDDRPTLPEVFALHYNFPNPFNATTSLRYDLPERSYVSLVIYDLLGREIRTLINRLEEPGYKSIVWNGTDAFGKPVGAGVYIYRIQADNYVQARKMVLLK